MSFSELLKQCRKKQGISQAELASKLGVTQQAVGKWESGKSSPDPSTVARIAANETLLYSPELKFYSNKVKMDENLDTNIKGLHCLGDSSGWTRGLMMASVMGVLMGRKLAEKEGC